MFLGYTVLITAILLAGVAGYFSIVGLTALFAAAFWPVLVMGAMLETAKLVATAWLHYHWKTAPIPIRLYLVAAVGMLMLITSIGIFGFLSKGHLEQEMPLAQIQLQVNKLDNQIALYEDSIEVEKKRVQNAQSRLEELDAIVQTLIDYDKISGPDGAKAVRRQQKSERDEINDIINQAQEKISQINEKVNELRIQKIDFKSAESNINAKLGPIQYVADLLELEDQGAAVRAMIFMIMFAFDPVAVVLVIASMVSFKTAREEREKRKIQQKQEEEQERKARLEDEEYYTNLEKAKKTDLLLKELEEKNEQLKNIVESNEELNAYVVELEEKNEKFLEAVNEITRQLDEDQNYKEYLESANNSLKEKLAELENNQSLIEQILNENETLKTDLKILADELEHQKEQNHENSELLDSLFRLQKDNEELLKQVEEKDVQIEQLTESNNKLKTDLENYMDLVKQQTNKSNSNGDEKTNFSEIKEIIQDNPDILRDKEFLQEINDVINKLDEKDAEELAQLLNTNTDSKSNLVAFKQKNVKTNVNPGGWLDTGFTKKDVSKPRKKDED